MSLQRKDNATDVQLFAPLFAPVAARDGRTMAQTSVDAYRAKANTSEQRRKILALLARGERTLDDVSDYLIEPANRISGRFAEMKADGWIERTGDRRPTRAGARAFVWRITPAGRAALDAGEKTSEAA